MNRTIKFRAYNKKEKIFYYSEDGSGGWWGDCVIDCHKEFKDIQQFTGLLDKNGKEIYEGDIIKDTTYAVDDPTYKGKVIKSKFANNCGECGWIWGWDMPDDKESIEKNYEIIGNIYENPELINQSKRIN